MKMISRTKMRTMALAMLCAVSVSFIGSTNTYAQSPYPYADSFESYSLYSSIIDNNGWLAATNTYAIVTNGNPSVGNGIWVGFSGGRVPLADAAHSKVVKLDTETGSVSNFIDPSGQGVQLWLGMMVQPRQWSQDDPPSTADTTIRAMFYFTTNGYLVNYCSTFMGPSFFVTNNTGYFSKSVASNEWVRLTVQWDYNMYAEANSDFYKIQINGVTITNDNAYKDDLVNGYVEVPGDYIGAGTWFMCANAPGSHKLNSIQLSGIGYMDDFVVTNGPVNFGGGSWLVTAIGMPVWADVSVVAPSGTFFVADGAMLVISNNPAPYWTNAYIVVNGSALPAIPEYTNAAVHEPIFYTNYFAPVMAVSNTPQWWLSQCNLTNGGYSFNEAATNDTDTDGYPNWFEYLSSTDPNSADSYFRITDHYRLNGTTFVKWLSANIDPGLPPFRITRTTNLVTQPFTNLIVFGQVTRGLTNIWAEYDPPEGVPAFYRILATNNVP